ncbi:hypothetical protein MRB53_028002 [Persea americana]|uniref:Uncharacterized protein n=1 Tax=Persea americana TaxID=3435 RepID=A0ACC2KEH8_PERAE|nr:hypothetical protein MRB53_028002 [Persea americana]
MQSRLVVVVRWSSFFPLFPRCLSNYRLFTSSQRCGAGDPAVHSEVPQDEEAEEATKATTAQKPILSTKFQTIHFYYPTRNIAHIPSSPKLENPTIVNIPLDLCYQQKRQNHNAPTRAIEEVDCVGWDGAPTDDQQWRDEEDDYVAYYKEHRPSPISEIIIAETRKPIRKATDGGVEGVEYGAGEELKGWLPEQLDTAEEALLRAERMFWKAKERGDPDSPQSKVLRRLRGEDF